MLKKIFALSGVAVIAALLVPSTADAGTQVGVVVFVGGAGVGDEYGPDNVAPHIVAGEGPTDGTTDPQGLCLPTHAPTGLAPSGCVLAVPGGLATPTQEWAFDIPGTTLPAPLPPASFCWAAGAFSDGVADPGDPDVITPGTPATDVTGATNGNCAIVADGNVGGNALGVGPSCGMSGGESAQGAADSITIDGQVNDFYVTWKTSAGGTLLLDGTIGDPSEPGDVENFVGVTQARPLPPEDCRTVAAATFNVVGVVAVGALL